MRRRRRDRVPAVRLDPGRRLPADLSDEQGVTLWMPNLRESTPRHSRHIVHNLTRPERSLLLLAPLSLAAGGWGLCRDPGTGQAATVFAGTEDPDYRDLLALCEAGRAHLERIRRFDMPGFRPGEGWLREMQRYGILPADLGPDERIDVYATEDAYWRSLWHRPR